MKKILNNKKGFTLIELIIVIAVIAILAAIAIPSYMNVIDRAEESKAVAAARNAFNLAQVQLLTDKIDNEDPTSVEDLNSAIATSLGLDVPDGATEATDSLTIAVQDDDPYQVKSAKAKIGDHEYTVTGGSDLDFTED